MTRDNILVEKLEFLAGKIQIRVSPI